MVRLASAIFVALFGWADGYVGWADPDGKFNSVYDGLRSRRSRGLQEQKLTRLISTAKRRR